MLSCCLSLRKSFILEYSCVAHLRYGVIVKALSTIETPILQGVKMHGFEDVSWHVENPLSSDALHICCVGTNRGQPTTTLSKKILLEVALLSTK